MDPIDHQFQKLT